MILRVDGLRKSYANGVVAVSHAELKLDDGEFISIVGRSGSGKSTLLAMIGALMRPTEGQVFLGNDAIWTLQETELADLRCREFGFVFQFPSLLPNLQVIDNVALPALVGRTLNASDAYSRAKTLLERIGLRDGIRCLSCGAIWRRAKARGHRARTHQSTPSAAGRRTHRRP